MRGWIRSLWRKLGSPKTGVGRAASRKPALEALEDRSVPTITMTILTAQLVQNHASPPVPILSFTDTNNVGGNSSLYQVSINWNDGSALDTATGGVILRASTADGGTFQVLGDHIYTSAGSFPVTITLHSNLDNTNNTAYSIANVETANQHFVESLYQSLLHRPVDPTGLKAWTTQLDQGASRSQVVFAIEQSGEYRMDVIGGLYAKLLNRAVDPSGSATWNAFLAHGGTVEQLEAVIIGSGEYFARRGGGTNGGWLQAVYQDVLNRGIDVNGLQTWSHDLIFGFTRGHIAQLIINNAEGFQVEVQTFYQQFLNRNADSDGLNHFVAAMLQGTRREPVIAGILGSDEYFSNF